MIKTTSFLIALGSLIAGVTAHAQSTTIFTDTFTYANGPLTTVSNGLWTTTSGTAGEVDVANNAVNITGTETEDVAAPIGGQTYTTGTLTATFTVNFSVLPTTAAGTYFSHFRDAGTGFRGRIFAQTTGAAAGSFRLAISNTTNTAAQIPTDLALNTTYTLTLSLNVATGGSTLAVNGGTAVAATDATTAVGISTYAFRQATGEGTLVADNLVVAYVPEPATYAYMLGGLGVLALVVRRRRVTA